LSEEKKMGRRTAIKALVGAAVAAAAIGGGYYAMQKPEAPPPKPTPTTVATPTTKPAPVTLNLYSSETGELTTKKGVAKFMDYYKDIKVEFQSLPWGDPYRDKMAIWFAQKEKVDVVDLSPEWSFGYMELLEPLDPFPGAKELKEKMIPSIRESFADPAGNLTGLPWYAGEISLFYNEKILADAGIEVGKDQLFKTWDDFTNACLLLKEKGWWGERRIDAPIIFGLAKDFYGAPFAWASVTASIGKGAGRILDDKLNPLFNEGEPAYEAAEWIRKGLLEWKIIHPASVTSLWPQVREAYYSGAVAFIHNRSGYLKAGNDPKTSKIAIPGKLNANFSQWPGSTYTATYTEGWSMPRHCKNKNEAWKLLSFMGGKDWEGKYYMPKLYLFEIGRNPPYPEMYNDPEVIADMSKWINVNRLMKQYEKVIAMETIDTVRSRKAWYAKWIDLVCTQLQLAWTGKATTRQALDAIAAGLNELKKTG